MAASSDFWYHNSWQCSAVSTPSHSFVECVVVKSCGANRMVFLGFVVSASTIARFMSSPWSNWVKDILRGLEQDESSANGTWVVLNVSCSLSQSLLTSENLPSPNRFEGFIFSILLVFQTSGFVVVFMSERLFGTKFDVSNLFILFVSIGINIVIVMRCIRLLMAFQCLSFEI